MDKRLDTFNWAQVFGEPFKYSWSEATTLGSPPQSAMRPVAVPGDPCSDAVFTREDVAEALHIYEDGGHSYAEWEGVVVVRLRDGRFAALSGWCDTSGWG